MTCYIAPNYKNVFLNPVKTLKIKQQRPTSNQSFVVRAVIEAQHAVLDRVYALHTCDVDLLKAGKTALKAAKEWTVLPYYRDKAALDLALSTSLKVSKYLLASVTSPLAGIIKPKWSVSIHEKLGLYTSPTVVPPIIAPVINPIINEIEFNRVLDEIKTTEQNYVHTLKIYKATLQNFQTKITVDQYDTLSQRLGEMISASEGLLEILNNTSIDQSAAQNFERLNEGLDLDRLAQVFLKLSPYIYDYHHGIQTIAAGLNAGQQQQFAKKLRGVVVAVEGYVPQNVTDRVRYYNIDNFAMAPVQRSMRYKLLFDELKNKTNEPRCLQAICNHCDEALKIINRL